MCYGLHGLNGNTAAIPVDHCEKYTLYYKPVPAGNHLVGCLLKKGQGGMMPRNARAVPDRQIYTANLMSWRINPTINEIAYIQVSVS